MVRISAAIAVLATASTTLAQNPPTCNINKKCPTESPCCSQYGECGTGAYCLGGCDPRSSNNINSCMPAPVCKDLDYDFTSLNGITPNTKYLGDSSTTDWVMSGEAVPYDGNVLLTMAPNTAGTVLASSTYMWYGNAKATFKTSRGRGVVTAFILLSDVQDEIDYEFIGVDLLTAQTNYYFQGNPDYDNAGNISLSDTFDNFHTYEIDWTPDQISWLVDGQIGRTKKRADTWNATSNQWDFPQTPARVQLSIWPGGLATNAKGTIDWAGGVIDWTKNDPDIASQGYYYATFKEASISCYKSPTPPGTNTGVSYTYNSLVGTNNTVVDGTRSTILESFLATGSDPEMVDPSTVIVSSSTSTSTSSTAKGKATEKSTTTQSAAAKSSEPATVPGLTNGGSGVDSHGDYSSSASAPKSTGSGSSDPGSDGTDSGGSTTCNGGFCQTGQSPDTNAKLSDGMSSKGQDFLQGSVFAVLIAGGILLAL